MGVRAAERMATLRKPCILCFRNLQEAQQQLDWASFRCPALEKYGVLTPCSVFDELPQHMIYRERGCRWYLVGFEITIPPGWLSMVAVKSWWALDGHCYFLVGFG